MVGVEKAVEVHKQYGPLNYPVAAEDIANREGLTITIWPLLPPVDMLSKNKYDILLVVRDANRLPNGNTLITGLNRIVEVTPQGEVVWRLALKEVVTHASGQGFYKAERIGIPK